MNTRRIIGLSVWWRALSMRVGLLMQQNQVRCEHLVTFIYWRPSWRGGFRQQKEFRCRLNDPLIGDPVSLWRACCLCEHNHAAARTVRRAPVVTERAKVPAA